MDNKLPTRFCLQKRPALEVLESLPELLLRVPHSRARAGETLSGRCSRKAAEPAPLVAGVQRGGGAAVEGRKPAIVCSPWRRRIRTLCPFSRTRERDWCIAWLSSTPENG